jgi:cytochrome P450
MDLDVFRAVTAPDPYPWYASLPAMAYDDRLVAWIATGPAAAAVLAIDTCAVRPPGVPFAGDLFARLARWSDGARHRALRTVAARCLAPLAASAAAVAAEVAAEIAGCHAPTQRTAITAFCLELGVTTVARLLGQTRAHIITDVAALAPCLARIQVSGEAGAEARAAADSLGAALGTDDTGAAAIGLLCQSYEAIAGLAGNTLVALGRGARGEVAEVVAATLRRDPPVHNTRRFATADVIVAGQRVRAGETIVAVLATIPDDPAATFGRGEHACPGAAIATSIATAGVRALLARGVDPAALIGALSYRPSPATRVPCFGATPAAPAGTTSA